jgi:hypothetical protein
MTQNENSKLAQATMLARVLFFDPINLSYYSADFLEPVDLP